jgi:hypothetical protein
MQTPSFRLERMTESVTVLELDVSGYFVAGGFAGQFRRTLQVDYRVDATRLRCHRKHTALAQPIARGGVAAEKGRRTGSVRVCDEAELATTGVSELDPGESERLARATLCHGKCLTVHLQTSGDLRGALDEDQHGE